MTPTGPGERGARPATIFVVDDDDGVRGAIAGLLASTDHRVAVESSGLAALGRLAEVQPDVVVLDWMMPGLDGPETCRRLKADPAWRHVPVILLTALSGREHVIAGLDAGADEFLSKPVSGPELRARVRSMVRIKRQHDALAEAMRLREELAQMIVHDMRSPLTSILGFTELALVPGALPSRVTEYLGRIQQQAQRLSQFTDEVLLVAKLELGADLVRKAPVDLAAMVREVQADLATAQAQRVRLEAAAPDALVAHADRELVRRLLENLVSNALKHSPAGGAVTLRAEPAAAPRVARLVVTDEGPGVPDELRGRLFSKFETTAARRPGQRRPIGLGLYFCRLVAEAHGGTIACGQNTPKGAVFTVEL